MYYLLNHKRKIGGGKSGEEYWKVVLKHSAIKKQNMFKLVVKAAVVDSTNDGSELVMDRIVEIGYSFSSEISQ